jgi:HPt (histidine-containing phosphotransfer) domain-containing protein
VAKPVEPENLFSCLAKWLEVSLPQETERLPALGDGGSADALALRQQLESIKGLDAAQGLAIMQNDLVSYSRLLGQFVSSHASDVAIIETHLNQGKYEEARGIAHSSKGAAGTLGLKDWHSSAADVEALLKSKAEPDQVRQALKVFAQVLGELTPQLIALKAPEARVDVTWSAEAMHSEMLKLHNLLELGDTTADQVLEGLAPQLARVFGDRVEALRQAVDEFDFDEAASLLQEMLQQQE